MHTHTVESRLSELQLSRQVNYPNTGNFISSTCTVYKIATTHLFINISVTAQIHRRLGQ